LSERAFSSLRSLAERHPTIGEVRGLGLMIGVEFVAAEGGPDPVAFDHVQDFAAANGLLVLSCGPDENVMRVLPPLVVTREELDQGIDIIDRALSSYEAR
jgi:4-aminobutyrate aminotransferase